MALYVDRRLRLRAPGLAGLWLAVRGLAVVVPLDRLDGQRGGAEGVPAYRELDPQAGRCQLLPQPRQRLGDRGRPGVGRVGGVELEERDLLDPVERGREHAGWLVVGF